LTNRQEAIKNIVVSDESVELYNLKRVAEYGTKDPYLMRVNCENARFVKRKYSTTVHSGYSYTSTDFRDTTRAVMKTSLYPKVNQSQLFPISANRITYVSYNLFIDFKEYTYIKYDIDTLGRRQSPIDSFVVPTSNSWYNLKRLSDSLYIIVNPDEYGVISVLHLDHRFRLIKHAKAPSLGVNLSGALITDISDKYAAFTYNYAGIFDDPKYEIIKVDLDGHLIGRWKFNDDGKYNGTMSILDMDSSEDIYLISNKKYRDGLASLNSLVVFKTNNAGTLDIIKEEKQLDRYRIILVNGRVLTLPNSSIILSFEEIAYKQLVEELNVFEFDSNAKAFSIACFTPEELGIKKSVNTQNISKDFSCTIYPNPTDDFINISMSEPFEGTIQLLDMSGRICRELEVASTSSVGVECSMLQSGLYIVQLIADGQVVHRGKVMKL
jgi:hypothetical protein